MNKKTIFIVIGAVVAVAVIVGGLFLFGVIGGKKQAVVPVAQQGQVVPTLTPDAIGLTLSLIKTGKFANNGVEMKVSKLDGITALDYELAYTSKGDIPRGAIGHSDVQSTDTVITQQLPFGTCSDVCHFDQDVTNIKITIKVTKTDGNVYQVESPFSL